MKPIQMTFLFFLVMIMGCDSEKNKFTGETLSIPGKDGIRIRADFYRTECLNKPLILLFHQAGYSRGEYREIGPKLNALGFCCLAIDQRSGSIVKDVINETAGQAKKKGLNTEYIDALPDLCATIDYVLEKNYASNGVILLGSSYSASLIFISGSKYKEQVKGLVAFSPGEYFTFDGKSISEFAGDVSCPVFITSSQTEKDEWEEIYRQIKSEKTFYLPDFKGYHGAKALWEENNGNESYWEALKDFLNRY